MERKQFSSWAMASLFVVIPLALFASRAGQAATYTLFGSTEQLYNGFALLRSIPGDGTLTGPASATGSLMVPGGRFHTTGAGFSFFPGAPSFAQLVNTFTSSQTAPHTFSAGGGPGGFEFCPPMGNPLNPACNQAAGLAGYVGFEGFLDYDAGPNQFGGTFRMARKTQSVVSARIATNPNQFQHQKEIRGALPAQAGGPTSFKSASFGQVPTTTTFSATRANWIVGLPYQSQYWVISGGPVTVSPVLHPTQGWIQTAGPVGTAMAPPPLPSTSTGFPFTTGKARQVGINSLGAIAAFTVTGGNFRGPSGQGNIVLVAGGIYQNRRGSGTASYAVLKLGLVDTTLPEPRTGLGLAAGLITLLIAGAYRRRR